MRGMGDNSVDSIVTDPPYGLEFMGKEWDHGVPCVATWREALRVLKPGGHLLSFGGSRMYHRMACAVEDAGFEIRDQIMWVYGCLDEQTHVATANGVMPYHKTKVGDLVLCYDAEHGTYSYQPILEVVEYDYNDTAYRITGDFGEQVVSRNHRVIVEHGGEEQFCLAENLNVEARVPFLESLPALQHALHDAQQNASCTKQDVQQGVCKRTDWAGEHRDNTFGEPQGPNYRLRGVREVGMETECVAAQDQNPNLQPGVQRRASRFSMGDACAQRPSELVGRVGSGAESAHDWCGKPGVDGWDNLPESEGCVCGSADQVRAVPCPDVANGSVGRLRDGAPHCGGVGNWANADTDRVCAPHQPRCNGQPAGELDAVCDELGAQEVRAWAGHKTSMVRVVPFHYTGKVWCLRVPTGAFVAVRNGVAFPTGNSGFPKSHNGPWGGTALKPAHEPIVVARKPLIGTVAANVLAHGTGGLNIDGCRVGGDVSEMEGRSGASTRGLYEGGIGIDETWTPNTAGRWPANLIHDGSDEVLAAFPVTASGAMKRTVEGYDGEGVTGFLRGRSGPQNQHGDAGSAARFFYCAKASKKDRNEGCEDLPAKLAGCMNMRNDAHAVANGLTYAHKTNNHPTVKPTDLMAYLCRLVTPPGGIVLDPFMGSGSTGKAALREGFRFIGIEKSPEYLEIAKARVAPALPKGFVF